MWFYPLKTKSGFHVVFGAFIKFVQTQISSKIKIFQSDGGTKFLNHHIWRLLEDNGTFHRISCPYTPQQNGRVERKHRHIIETGLAMLFNGHVPSSYWIHAFRSAVHIINRLPTRVLNNKSPFEVLFLRAPSYDHFRPFGCQVYPYLRDYAEHKLSPRSLPCIFLGYCAQYKGYECLDPDSSCVFITLHAKFDELFFPFGSTSTRASIHDLHLVAFFDDTSFSSPPLVPAPSPPQQPTAPFTSYGLCNDPAPVTEARSPEQAQSSEQAQSPEQSQSTEEA